VSDGDGKETPEHGDEHGDLLAGASRRNPTLVATPLRIVALALAIALAAYALSAMAARVRAGVTLEPPALAVVFGVALVVLTFVLRSDDARLTRELRIARTGSASVRATTLTRRERGPRYLRWLSTTLGTTAVHLSDGDRFAAESAFERDPFFYRVGTIAALRTLVRADLARATDLPGERDRAIATLASAPATGHIEVDRYRTHVLVKALLEKGDPELAERVARELMHHADDEQRVYAVWLHVWFDGALERGSETATASEAAPTFDEGTLRLAALLARTHGATELVQKIEDRIAASAARD
jgi:hypothetical protein